jgi:hypothetical protein
MKRLLIVMAALLAFSSAVAQGQTRIGVGAHYWRTVDNLGDDFDRDGVSYLATVQRSLFPLLALQVDVERFPDGYAGSQDAVWGPQAFAIVGGAIYAGLGIGILYSDGDFADEPFYVARAGLDLELLPGIHFDINANYQFSEWSKINELDEEVDSDTVTLGAAIRIDL